MRGASVYFNEFADEKRKRELQELQKQFGEEETEDNKQFQLVHAKPSNDRINDNIYKQINGLRDAAFISTLAIPTIILVVMLVLAIFVWIASLK